MGHIDNLGEAFSNGKLVVMLTQLAFGESIPTTRIDPASNYKLLNTEKCLQLMAKRGVALEAVTAEEIVNGQKIPIKILCQALEREHKRTSVSDKPQSTASSGSRVKSSNPDTPPTGERTDNTPSSRELIEQTVRSDASAKLSLEDITIETAEQSDEQLHPPNSLFSAGEMKAERRSGGEPSVKSSSREIQATTSLPDSYRQLTSHVSEKVKPKKPLTIEIPTQRASNKFLPSPPHPSKETPAAAAEEPQAKGELIESKKTEYDAKILRTKSKQPREEPGLVPKQSQLKQKRYSPLDLQKLAGKLLDAFSGFSSSDLHDLTEENEDSLLTSDTMDSQLTLSEAQPTDTRDEQQATTSVAIDSNPVRDGATASLRAESAVRENVPAVEESLTVLPPLSLDDLTPEAGDTTVKKDAKRILRKTKRQATSIDSQDVASARHEESPEQQLEYSSLTPLPADQLLKQDSLTSDTDIIETLDKLQATADTAESPKHRKREKSSSKDNHRVKPASRHESALTETHSLEDIWQEIQRMKTTVRTHHAIASRFAQDYPVMRRCFESQSQTVRRLERSQHARNRNTERQLQDKLALMEGYLVQTMRENADLRSKVWGLTTRLTQLEKSGISSRPASLLSLSESQRRDHSSIQDMSKFSRFMKLKKFFGEEPPPLLEEIPTSFTHDTSKEDDEIV